MIICPAMKGDGLHVLDWAIGGAVDVSSLCEAEEWAGDYDKEVEEEVSRRGTSFFCRRGQYAGSVTCKACPVLGLRGEFI